MWTKRGGGGRLFGVGIRDAMNELGIAGERLGVDRLDMHLLESLRAQEINVVDGRVPMDKARVIKTVDEISLIRQACAIADVAITRTRDAIAPGGYREQALLHPHRHQHRVRRGAHGRPIVYPRAAIPTRGARWPVTG